MRREDILQLTRAVPFRPFRVFVSNGQTFDVFHPDMIVATLGSAFIGVPATDGQPGAADTGVHVSLYHVQKIELLPTPTPPAAANGAG